MEYDNVFRFEFILGGITLFSTTRQKIHCYGGTVVVSKEHYEGNSKAIIPRKRIAMHKGRGQKTIFMCFIRYILFSSVAKNK